MKCLKKSNLVIHLAVPTLRQFLVLFEWLASLYQQFGGLGGDNRVRWDRFENECHSAYLAAPADGDWTQDGGSYADSDIVFDGGMTLLEATGAASPPARRAERDLVVQHDVVADHGGLTNDDTGTVVNEETFADLSPWMNLNAAGHEAGKL